MKSADTAAGSVFLSAQLEMAKAGVNLFVEKPLSVRPAAEVAQLAYELKHIQDRNK